MDKGPNLNFPSVATCGKALAGGQWWKWCGETDMGQTIPVQCIECEPKYGLLLEGASDQEVEAQAKKIKEASNRYKASGYQGNLSDH